ncbi:TPA: hypothetical protein DEB00_01225, partial [Candidatus Uhrbacteria bacterium]|nr:hypothetical protein [Candidatus Uhrbacteria bacterium]
PAITATTNHVLPPELIGPTLVYVVSHPFLLLGTLLIVGAAILCQTALIHITHRHSFLRKHAHRTAAFHSAFLQLPRMILVHIASLSAVFLLVLDMSMALDLLTGTRVAWITIPVMLIDGLLILYVLTIKMLVLQFIAGDNQRFLSAVQQAWRITWRSPALILEHNLLLFALNALVITLLVFAVQIISLFTSAFGTWVYVAFGNQLIGTFLEILVLPVGSLFVAGIAASYNFSVWSHLAKNLEKQHLPSVLKSVFRKS